MTEECMRYYLMLSTMVGIRDALRGPGAKVPVLTLEDPLHSAGVKDITARIKNLEIALAKLEGRTDASSSLAVSGSCAGLCMLRDRGKRLIYHRSPRHEK